MKLATTNKGMALKLLTIQDVMDTLNISYGHVYREIARGRLHRVKIGSCTRITADEVHRYVSMLTAEAEQSA